MSWRDSLSRVKLADGRELIGASFRGAPFLVDSSDRSGGRRIHVHEFPLRNDPAIDDLGRQSRVFSVEGYVLGDTYVAQRDVLLAALEDESGPGELVHPYFGTRRAICSSLSVRESIADGGMARFAIEFTDVPVTPPVPLETPDLAAAVDASATAALTAAQEQLEAGLEIDGQPSFARASLAADLVAVTEGLGAALEGVVTDIQERAQLDVELAAIASTASLLVRDPADLFAALLDVLGAAVEAATALPRAFLRALLDAYDVPAQPTAEGITETREIERANQIVMAGAIRQLLVIEAARLITTVEYDALDDALEDRDAVAERLEEQAETAGDTAYPALVKLRADVLQAVPGDAVLARVVTIEKRTPVPALVLSYQLYGTVDNESDILARNGAQHPGFLSGELEVLSDV